MQVKFSEYIRRMPVLRNELKATPLLNRNELEDIPKSGIYVFYREGKSLYVGRSNRLKGRVQEHGRPSSDHYSATLAFRMAKEEMARLHDIPKDITRKELEEAPGFDMLFFNARLRVAQMKIRVIEVGVDDQVEQALFEIYAALALHTKYNDFGTH